MINILYVKDPQWANADHTLIDCIIKTDHILEELPFTANPNDVEEHGRLIYAAAMNGEYGPIAEYVSPPPLPEPTPLTPQQKLEAAGLSVDELKQLLGL